MNQWQSPAPAGIRNITWHCAGQTKQLSRAGINTRLKSCMVRRTCSMRNIQRCCFFLPKCKRRSNLLSHCVFLCIVCPCLQRADNILLHAMAALPLVNDWVARLQGSKPVCACCRVAISLHKLRWLEGIVMGYHRPCGRPIFYMGLNAQATDEVGHKYFPCCAECCHEHKELAASHGYRLRSP